MYIKLQYSPAEADEHSLVETYSADELGKDFMNELKGMYWAEKHYLKCLPKMHKASNLGYVKEAFREQLVLTALQLERLEQVFELAGELPKAKKTGSMAEVLDDIGGVIDETQKGSGIREAGLVLAAQKIKNFEIATYASLLQQAGATNNEEVVTLLQQNLTEDKDAAETFTSLAEMTMILTTPGKQISEVEERAPVSTVYDSINLDGKKPAGIKS